VGPGGSDVSRASRRSPMTGRLTADHSALWIPLVRHLTQAFPNWTIWKNADAALAGSGDIDSAAPASDWDAIVLSFRRWAHEYGLGPVIDCRHPPRTMFLVALDQSRTTFLELDVLGRKYFRGGTLFRAQELVPLSRLDPRGFRIIRPAAQALILLLCNGLRWGGRADVEGIQKRHVVTLLKADLAGVAETAKCLHLPERSVRAAAESLLSGQWDRRSMMEIERSALFRAFREPWIIVSRARFRALSKRRCPLLRSVFYGDRLIPGDPEAWLHQVARTHRVYD
jgi:hypothetical protein